MKVEEVAWIRRLARSGTARSIREAAGISVRELAGELGVSPGAVSRWERGQRSPRSDTAAKWAEVLRRLA